MNQREQQRLETRRTLAEHAIRLFDERGFDETTVEEIATAAGVSQRTFFLHFPTKAAAAFPDHDERVVDFVRRLGDGAGQHDPVRHVCRTVLTGLDHTTPMRGVRYRLLTKVPALRDEDARTDRDYEDAVATFLVQAWGTGTEARIRAHAVANAVLGVVRASLVAWSESGVDARTVCAEILDRMFGSPLDRPLQSLQSLQRDPPVG